MRVCRRVDSLPHEDVSRLMSQILVLSPRPSNTLVPVHQGQCKVVLLGFSAAEELQVPNIFSQRVNVT